MAWGTTSSTNNIITTTTTGTGTWDYESDGPLATVLNQTLAQSANATANGQEERYYRGAKKPIGRRVTERISHTPAGFNSFDVGKYETLLESLQREFNIWTKSVASVI